MTRTLVSLTVIDGMLFLTTLLTALTSDHILRATSLVIGSGH